jgi:hypothetical protein
MSELAFDGEQLKRRACELAFPRYPGTAGGSRAIEIVARWLGESGLAVERQAFNYDVAPAFRALRALLLGCAAAVAAAGLWAQRAPLAGLVTVGLALAAGGLFLVWTPWLEAIYRRPGPTTTENLWVRRAARDARLTLVVLAHHDSKSQNLTMPVRAGLVIGALVGAVVLVTALVWRWLGGADGALTMARLAAGSAGLALLVLATLKSGNRSPGGVDNAGSVAIVAELASRLPDLVPADVELVFLATGAEEDHMIGAMRWLDRSGGGFGEREVYALNFDGAGIPGRVVLLERFGAGRPFAPRLARLARSEARRLGLRPRGVLLPPAMGIDAIPFAHRGIECLTLASGSLSRASLAVHSAADRGDNLDPEALAAVAELGAAVSVRLASGAREM